jgi:hypothetical protein
MQPLQKADAQELLRQSARAALQSLPVECVTGKPKPRHPLTNAQRLDEYRIRRGLHGLLQQLGN